MSLAAGQPWRSLPKCHHADNCGTRQYRRFGGGYVHQPIWITSPRSASYISVPYSRTGHKDHSMRFPSFPAIVRTFYTLTNTTSRALPASQRALGPFTRGTILRSMPTIPFLGSLFSSGSSSKDMSYSIQKSDDEWRAVLNPGNYPPVKVITWAYCPAVLLLLK